MKSDIHPEYSAATITCACGNVVETHSTKGSFTVDVCAACHPFYTGRQKMLDTAGRVDRFRKKYAATGGKTVRKGKAAKAPAKK
ncbi:MAG: 50S ribosomal protein L31 [Myxococcota bacterium]